MSPIQGTNDCNTQTIEFKENGMNHMEGGWPKDIDVNENDQVRQKSYIIKDLVFPVSIEKD